MVESTLQSFANYSVITLRGSVTPMDLVESLSENAASLKSPNLVWDFLDAEILVSSPQDFKDVARAVDEILAGLFGSRRRTAFVTRSELRGTTLAIYITVATRENVASDYRLFKTLPEAVEWVTQSH